MTVTQRTIEVTVTRGTDKFNPESALILNSGYEPVKIIDWKKAIILWLQNRVDVLEFQTVFVHSASQSFQLPSVLRLRQYIRPYFTVKDRPTRMQVFKRDGQTCQYCEKWFPLKDLTIDHVVPLSKGGQHTWDNVVTACSKCNNKKGNLTLKQLGISLPRQPIKPESLLAHRLGGAIPEAWLPFFY